MHQEGVAWKGPGSTEMETPKEGENAFATAVKCEAVEWPDRKEHQDVSGIGQNEFGARMRQKNPSQRSLASTRALILPHQIV
jgi:hypothetical protein